MAKSRFPNDNGLAAVLLAIGGLAAVGLYQQRRRQPGSRRRRVTGGPRVSIRNTSRGSMAKKQQLSTLQRKLLYLIKQYGRDDPEAAIRSIDLIIGTMTASPEQGGVVSLSKEAMLTEIRGYVADTPRLLEEARAAGDRGRVALLQADMARFPADPGLREYLVLIEDKVRAGRYLDVDLIQATPYELLVDWVGKNVKKVLRAMRKNRPVHPELGETRFEAPERDVGARIFVEQGYYDEDYAELTPQEEIMVQHILIMGDNLIEVSDWYKAIVTEAREANRPIGQYVGEIDIDDQTGEIRNLGQYEPVELMRLSVPQARRRAEHWHTRVAALTRAKAFVASAPELELPEGWGVNLLDAPKGESGIPESFKNESAYLGHCIGKGYGYAEKARKGIHAYYSIRTPRREPRFTIEMELPRAASPTLRIHQVKGMCNVAPGKRAQYRDPDTGELLDIPWGESRFCEGFGASSRPATPEELRRDSRHVIDALRALLPRLPLDTALSFNDLGEVRGYYNAHRRRLRELALVGWFAPPDVQRMALASKDELIEAFLSTVSPKHRAKKQEQGRKLSREQVLDHVLKAGIVIPWATDFALVEQAHRDRQPQIAAAMQRAAAQRRRSRGGAPQGQSNRRRR